MGLYDRDYARPGRSERRPAGFGPGWLASLSFVNLLIAINVAVFVGDAFMSARGIVVPVQMGDYFVQGYDPARNKTLVPRAPSTAPMGGAADLAILDATTGQIVGQRRYRWMPPMQAYGHFSTAKGFLSYEVWRLVTFQFLHADISHLFMNMLGMFFFGPDVEARLRTRGRAWSYYLVCGIFGAVLYLTLNILGYLFGASIPGFLFQDMSTPLIGASAGVFGVLMASAYIAGNAQMLLFMVLPVKVRTGAYLLAAAALFNLLRGGANAGGDAAHVGGAIAGYFFIRNTHLLRDFFDVFGNTNKAKARRAKSKPSGVDQSRVDAVLEKVREHGLHSLTAGEQAILRRATEERRGE